MIRRILFALACTASIPAILGAPPAHSATVAPSPAIQMEHISVTKIGKGSPVILIPGLGSPRAAWDGIAPELSRTHTVYLVQVNGFANDDPRANVKPGVLTGIVDDVVRLIAAEKLGKPALVGHSMGGLVGLMIAARHADSIGKLMVVDALPFFAATMAPPGTELSVAMVEPRAAQMRDAVAAGYGKPADPAAAEANVAGLTIRPENVARMKAWAMAADPRVMALCLYEDLTTDMRSELGAIKAPVTVVYAWNQRYPLKDRAEPFFRTQFAGVANLTLADAGESGHFVMLDQPAGFAAALTTFLAG